MSSTPLTSHLTGQISDYIRAENAPSGTRLVERKLAEHFRVSRSPIRSALQALAAEGVVGLAPGGGFIVLEPGRAPAVRPAPASDDEDIYLRIAEDRLQGVLADKITENALVRRYGLTRAGLARMLRRIAGEGWIERLPGHGWAFLPMLTSMHAYEDSYRFRLVIEPAAILEPGFVLNRPALEACRAQQQGLVDGEIWGVSNAMLFDLNSQLHEAVIECSRNPFFIDGLRRIDRLRRLIEYRQSLDRKYAIVRCREHVQLVDLLLAERRQEASDFMRRHLSSVSLEKTLEKAGRGEAAPVA